MNEGTDLFAWKPSQSGPAAASKDAAEDGIPPVVYETFERLALGLKAKGFDRYSADAILHQVRWHHQVERGDREFACNNNWTAPLARWLMNRHRHMAGFFELRERKARKAAAAPETDVRVCRCCGEEHDINLCTESQRTWMQWLCPSCGSWEDRPEALRSPESPI